MYSDDKYNFALADPIETTEDEALNEAKDALAAICLLTDNYMVKAYNVLNPIYQRIQ
jgi:hypothetical protein